MKASRSAPGAACAILGLIFLPFLYVLSIGPALWLIENGYCSEESVGWIYVPLASLANHNETIGRLLIWYMSFFGDLSG